LAQAQTPPSTIRVGLQPTEQALPLQYAMRAGLFERAGIKIDVSKMESGAASAAAVLGGGLDIGNSSLLALILGHAKGVPFTIIAPSGIVVPNSDYGLVVTSSSPLRTAKDFEGKTIAPSSINDINDLSMRNWMDKNGADSSTIKVLTISQVAAVAALEQGRVDGILVSNPAYTLATANGKGRAIANVYAAVAPRLLIVTWFSTTDWVQRNRPLAQAFARVIAEAAGYVNGHVAETVDDLVALTGQDRSLVLQMRRTTQTTTVSPSEIQPLIDVAAKYKAIDRPFPASELISNLAQR
jgi:NitT/TauT family transport system substrate-binding protein